MTDQRSDTVGVRRMMLLAVAALAVTAAAPPFPHDHGEDRRALGLDALRVALASEPLDEGVLHDRITFLESRLEDRPGDPLSARGVVSTRLLRFRAYNEPSELDRADALLSELEARYPTDPGIHGMRVGAALAAHDFPAAMSAAEARSRLSPPRAEGPALARFDALWATGAYDEARSVMERTTFRKASIGVLSREARLVDGLGDVAEAAEKMERVVELVDAYSEPRIVRAWARVELGSFLTHSGRPDAGVGQFVDALALVPGYAAALEGLGWIAYGVDGDLAAAEALLSRSARYGHHLDLLLVLEEIAGARGDDAAATGLRSRFLAEATADERTERMYWRPLAQVLAERDETLDRALHYAELDLAQRQDRGAWATRGWVLHRLGRTEEAVADMERAVAWGAPTPDVLALAGQVLLEAGHTRRGGRLVREALDGRAELGPIGSAELEAMLGSH